MNSKRTSRQSFLFLSPRSLESQDLGGQIVLILDRERDIRATLGRFPLGKIAKATRGRSSQQPHIRPKQLKWSVCNPHMTPKHPHGPCTSFLKTTISGKSLFDLCSALSHRT